MGEKAEPKISLPEIVFIGIFLAVLDAIDLIPFAGDITDVFAAPLIFYYVAKHINGVAYGVSLILDAIPGLQEIPSRSIVWWITVAIDRFAPKQLTQVAESVGELSEGEGIEGGLAEEEAAQATVMASKAGEGVQMAQGGEAVIDEAEAGASAAQKGADSSTEGTSSQENNADKKNGDIELGAEISPEEEAEGVDFGSVPEDEGDDDSEEEEDQEDEQQRPDNKVVDIRTRKPLNNRQSSNGNSSDDQDLPKAA